MGEGGGGEEKGSFSPSALSFFRLHLSPFPPETPDTQATQTLVHALVMGRVDYCNSLLFGLPAVPLGKLHPRRPKGR